MLNEAEKLLKKYKKKQKILNRNQKNEVITMFKPLVMMIAKKISMRLPANIELDDLISAGIIGLMDAIDKYDPSRDNKFKTYAEFRIRGTILDELRAQDWIPRSMREKAKNVERVYAKIEQRLGRAASEHEAAHNMGMQLNKFQETLHQCRSISMLSLDDVGYFANGDRKSIMSLLTSDSKNNPWSKFSQSELKKQIAAIIADLPEKQRMVLALYYYEDLNLKEIGNVLEVTESRVSQLHTQAMAKLKQKLAKSLHSLSVES